MGAITTLSTCSGISRSLSDLVQDDVRYVHEIENFWFRNREIRVARRLHGGKFVLIRNYNPIFRI